VLMYVLKPLIGSNMLSFLPVPLQVYLEVQLPILSSQLLTGSVQVWIKFYWPGLRQRGWLSSRKELQTDSLSHTSDQSATRMSSKKYRLGDISLQGIWVCPLLCSQTTVLSDLMDLFTAVLIPDDIVRIGEAGAKGAKQNFACVFAPACIGRFGRWSCARSLQIRCIDLI
jgi:hypothetical protein